MKKLLVYLCLLMSVMFTAAVPSSLARDAAKSADTVEVKGYTKKDGTKVSGYTRKKAGTDTEMQEVKGYTKKDGTKVAGYKRKKAK